MREYTVLLVLGVLIFELACTEIHSPRIAIIGGGIGGASTSHFLTELFNQNLKIDLYEAKTIGGRLATVTIDNIEVETGGAIIHSKNIYMQKFVELLGLEQKYSSDSQSFGIWNGSEFVFTKSDWFFVSLMKLIYRYGFQIFKVQRPMYDAIENFLKIYDLQDAGRSFTNVTEMLSAVIKEFPALLQTSTKDYFMHMGIGEKIIDELVEPVVTTNYNQDVDIPIFVSLVSLAATDANLWSVKGGNKGVPEHLIYRNKNINVIPSSVTKVHYIPNNSYQYEVSYTNKDGTNLMTSKYDIVIIAAPLTYDQEYPIEFVGFPKNLEFPGSYQTTYVTMLKADLNLKYFDLQEPLNAIMSCNPNKTKISSVGEVTSVDGLTEESSQIWKIFSRKSLEEDIIHDMFSQVIEKKEIVWKAYPRYTTSLYTNNFKLHDALYHVNAIEWAASTMEMSAIAGRNVAILAHDDFLQKHNSISTTAAYETTRKKSNSEL